MRLPSDPSGLLAAPPAAWLLSEFADDPEMVELVELFVAGLPAQMAKLEAAGAAGDHDGLRRLAHQLKGAAGGYGFPTITDAAGSLEAVTTAGAPFGEELSALLHLCRCARAQPEAGAPASARAA
jgi:HPt (histidine-containing phosphotransfer) domain-containing protein